MIYVALVSVQMHIPPTRKSHSETMIPVFNAINFNIISNKDLSLLDKSL